MSKQQTHEAPRQSLSGNKKKTAGLYVTGYILSLILTLLAFALVEYKALSVTAIMAWISIFAVAQLLVQIFCFLRLNIQSDSARWNMTAFLFTLLVIFVVVAGTLWILANLNYRMVH